MQNAGFFRRDNMLKGETMMRRVRNLLFGTTTVVASMVVSGGAFAQVPKDATPGPSSTSTTTPTPQGALAPAAETPTDVGDIVVTAEKRRDPASRVPLSISVIGGDALSKQQIHSAVDVVKQVPGLVLTPSPAGTPIYNLRGLGFNTPNLSSASPVGVYVDQVAYVAPYMANGPIFDIGRVEVLKGPQGTLYGRNTTGGLVNYVTNQPTDHLDASITFEGGNYKTLNNRGYVSGPLSLTLKARLAWDVENSFQGWQKSLTRNDRLGEIHKQAVRGIVAWEPSSDFKAVISASYWHDNSDTQAPRLAYYVPENAPFGIGAAAVQRFLLPNGGENNVGDWTSSSYQPSPNTSTPRSPYARNSYLASITADLEYRLSDQYTLTSLTGYNYLRRDDTQNEDGTAYEISSANLLGKVSSLSEELRLSSTGVGYNWMIGGYYSRDRIDENQIIYLADFSTINLLRAVGASLNDPRYSPTQILEGFRVNNQTASFHNHSLSAFANAQVDLTRTVKLTGGLRYTQDVSRFAGCAADAEGNTIPVWNTAVALLAGGYPAYNVQPGQCMTFQNNSAQPEGLFRDTLKENNLSWRANVAWTPLRDMLLYTSVSRGYKSGSFPVIPANRALQFEPAKQEEVTSYEVGAKVRVGIARLTLASYYNDYKSKQVFGAIADPVFASLARLVNIPRSETYGAEANADVSLSREFKLHGSASYICTKVLAYTGYDQFGKVLDFRGTEFPNTPRWQLAGSVDYQHELTDSLKTEFIVDGTYQSRSHGDFQDLNSYTVFAPFMNPTRAIIPASIYRIPGYALANASLELADRADRWRVSFFVKNLLNHNYWTSATYTQDALIRFTGLPRTYGASVTFNFGK